jgi:hypothetical protein
MLYVAILYRSVEQSALHIFVRAPPLPYLFIRLS